MAKGTTAALSEDQLHERLDRLEDRARQAVRDGLGRLGTAWIGTGTLLGALLPVLDMAVIAAFIPFYWRRIPGEIASPKPRSD
jgi:hypothetical protein